METPKKELLDFLSRQRTINKIAKLKGYKKCSQFSEIRFGNLNGKPVKQVCFTIKSSGCGWLVKGREGNDNKDNEGGCIICSHPLKTTVGGIFNDDKVLSDFFNEFRKYNYDYHPVVCLYNSGSFLNDDEISVNVRLNIFKEIAKDNHIKRIFIESRPEYIDEKKLEKIKEILGNKDLVIAIGLDSADDNIRNLCINKGLDKKKYEEVVPLINKYFKSLTYILLKPPFISEYTAVIDAVRSIHYAFSVGTRIVSLEACNVQDLSLTYYLEKYGCYRSPWLWSIIEVIERCFHLGPIFIGGFRINPLIRSVAHNCGSCDTRITELLERYNLFMDKRILSKAGCKCKNEWEPLMNGRFDSKINIDQSINDFLVKVQY